MRQSNGDVSPLRILLCSVMTILTLTSVVYALGQNATDTQLPVDTNADFDIMQVPFPGAGWLKALNEDVSNEFAYKNQIFSSVYDAILHHDPASFPVMNFNAYINSWILPNSAAIKTVETFGTYWGHYVLCYIRNLLAGTVLYYAIAGFFHYHCYVHSRSEEIFKDRPRPSSSIIWDQIKLAQASLFIYTTLPVISDYLIENGYTKCYYNISDIGGFVPYISWMLLYFSIVEIGIYWMHRTLHTNKTLYKYIHGLHHKYSKPHTLTPWASIAFNPLDGMLQACPYVICLFFVPCHYLTHVGLLFFTELWATYIHDSMDWNLDPIMGSKYHTVHHTHFIYNYGQVFTFCDRIWGTLRVPVGKTGVAEGPNKQKLLPVQKGLFGGVGRGGGRSGKNKSI